MIVAASPRPHGETGPDVPDAKDDHVIDQGWDRYTADDHAIWRALFERQARILHDRAFQGFLDGLSGLGVAADGIPEFDRLSDILDAATGWRIVAVPGLVPDDVFFRHLAARRFPATNWIRTRHQMDYMREPDEAKLAVSGCASLLDPACDASLPAYGRGGRKARRVDALPDLARLYWYTVEFGLIQTPAGLRIFGSGIVSSKGESVYCLESPEPARVAFDLYRVMGTKYRIDDYQEIYFVINSVEDLMEATRPDFAPLYERLKTDTDLEPGEVVPTDVRIPRRPH